MLLLQVAEVWEALEAFVRAQCFGVVEDLAALVAAGPHLSPVRLALVCLERLIAVEQRHWLVRRRDRTNRASHLRLQTQRK